MEDGPLPSQASPMPVSELIHSDLIQDLLAHHSGVAAEYRHIAKRATSGEPLALSTALLKWYEVAPEDRPAPETIRRLARQHLESTPLEARGLGFVILHRCGEDFYFLIVCTWSGSNELWQTVFYKDGERMSAFELFPREGQHKPTLCVWELVPAWREKEAWCALGLRTRCPRRPTLVWDATRGGLSMVGGAFEPGHALMP